VVSEEKFDHDETIEYVHKEKGQPDRLVRFCCDSCIEDLAAEPAKHFRKLDEAAKAKPGESKHHH